MKINNLFLIVLIFLPLVSGCIHQSDNSQNGLVTLDFTRDYDGITLNLSDIASDISVIRLETNEKSLMSSFTGFVGDKYIIATRYSKVILFSSDGKFQSIITTKGKGPKEFSYIDMWRVDNEEQFLYYHDAGKNYICKYNLDKHKFENNLPFNDKGRLSGMVIVNDSIFVFFPSKYSTYEYQYFYQTFSGRILKGEKRDSIENMERTPSNTPVFMLAKDGRIVYHLVNSDTIYYLSGLIRTPFLCLKKNDMVKKGSIKTGENIVLYDFYKDKVLFSKREWVSEFVKASNSIAVNVKNGDFFVADTLGKQLNRVDSLNYDLLNVWLNPHKVRRSNNNRFVCAYDAISFKSILNSTINDESISEEKKSKLKILYQEISDDDNPVIITGVFK